MKKITHFNTSFNFTFRTFCFLVFIRLFCAQFKCMALGTFCCYLNLFSILIVILRAIFAQIIITAVTMEKIAHFYAVSSITFITTCTAFSLIIPIRVTVTLRECMIILTFVLRLIG